MTEPEPADETLPVGSQSSSDDTKDPVEAGIRAVFEEESGDSRVDFPRSVVELLGDTTGAVSRISLREIENDASPVHISRDEEGPGEIPGRIGRYQIAGEIARGGVGSVFKARDVDLGRDVALKVLLKGSRANPEIVRRFVEEGQIGGQLQHPGIVPVHEMGLFAGERPFLAMKLVKGKTLARLLQERGDSSKDRQRFVRIFEQVCQPIAYAHARGVIHRDLKPSNVMVGAFGEVQVMDWGLAKVLAHGGVADEGKPSRAPSDASVIETLRSSAGSRSLAGSVLGTPAYMPPEQARGEVDSLDERSDVFGLGAILCEVLTGKPPYVASSVRETHHLARKGYLDDAMKRLDACGADREVIELAKRCLAFESRERPRDAGVVAEETAAYLRSLEERARASEVRAAGRAFE